MRLPKEVGKVWLIPYDQTPLIYYVLSSQLFLATEVLIDYCTLYSLVVATRNFKVKKKRKLRTGHDN